ncbi:hypothetical protein [Streptomyces avermitilis]|uniref:hypothetical protein n=1 Tax=Streptomyces avermitilis TaxID=33903 RepID=UPI0033F9A9C8
MRWSRAVAAPVPVGAARQAVVVLVHVVTASRTSWRVMRTTAPDAQVPAPVRDPDWVAYRSRQEHE